MLLSSRTYRRQVLNPPQGGQSERRREARLRYFWPVWYSSDGNLDIQQGRMVDLCSGGVSFLAQGGYCPTAGDQIWVRSSYPLVEDGSFGMASFTTVGKVLRSEHASPVSRKVAVEFGSPLEHCPAEVGAQAGSALGCSA